MNNSKFKITATASLAGLALAGCGGSHALGSKPAPAVTVTKPGPTITVTKPGPTVTVTRPGPTITVTEPGPTVTATQGAQAPSSGGVGGGAGGAGGAGAAGANQIIARLAGTGTKNTASFTTPSRWHLSWSYWGCPGGTSNFMVNEYNSDGSIDLNGISVNELGTGRGPDVTYAYGDAGTHYLSVNTEGCHWSLVPVTG